jgi:hypothetical protein
MQNMGEKVRGTNVAGFQKVKSWIKPAFSWGLDEAEA